MILLCRKSFKDIDIELNLSGVSYNLVGEMKGENSAHFRCKPYTLKKVSMLNDDKEVIQAFLIKSEYFQCFEYGSDIGIYGEMDLVQALTSSGALYMYTKNKEEQTFIFKVELDGRLYRLTVSKNFGHKVKIDNLHFLSEENISI